MSLPRVSILMPTNKCDEYFEIALNSCLKQTFSDFEIVIVANGVIDLDYANLKNIASDTRIRLYRTEVKYIAFSLNLGLHYCRGELIARMDADDIAYPNRLLRLVEFMDSNLDISVCGSFCDLIDNKQKIVGHIKYPTTNKGIRNSMIWINPFCHPSVIFRKKIVLECGGYPGQLASEDYALWVALSKTKSVKFANIPDKLLAYRANSNDHQRNFVKRASKAGVAATQIQIFGETFKIRWLFGALLSILKICFYAR
jgi:glycosyltransferase involved in cell wall biosynthesis